MQMIANELAKRLENAKRARRAADPEKYRAYHREYQRREAAEKRQSGDDHV